MQARSFTQLAWLIPIVAVIALFTPQVAHADHGYDGLEFILGAALGYAIHDAYGRDRNYYYHGTHRHRGWRGCRTRAHFSHAGGYRYWERSKYDGDHRRRGRHHRKGGHKKHRH